MYVKIGKNQGKIEASFKSQFETLQKEYTESYNTDLLYYILAKENSLECLIKSSVWFIITIKMICFRK